MLRFLDLPYEFVDKQPHDGSEIEQRTDCGALPILRTPEDWVIWDSTPGRGAFAPGQVYVALSRCRTLGGIRLTRPIRRGEVRCSPEVLRFYEALRSADGAGGEGSAEP